MFWRPIVHAAALGKWSEARQFYPNCSPSVAKGVPRRVRDQFGDDHAELPALLGVQLKWRFSQHEFDSSSIQPRPLNRLAKCTNVARCIDGRTVCRHLKSPMHTSVVVQKVCDLAQSRFHLA